MAGSPAPLPRGAVQSPDLQHFVSANAVFNTSRDVFSPFAKMVFDELLLFHRSHATSIVGAGWHLTVSTTRMRKINSIIMYAPKRTIFETAANLELWSQILPHYRYIRYLERSPNRNIVVMAATRSGIPISWTSEQIIDPDRLEIHFHHLKALTKGMHVVWTFRDAPGGVLVEIMHDLAFRVNLLTPIANKIIGDFFIHNIASKTLRCMKSYVEARANKVNA